MESTRSTIETIVAVDNRPSKKVILVEVCIDLPLPIILMLTKYFMR